MVAADYSSHRVVDSALYGVSLGARADCYGAEARTYLGFGDHIGFAEPVGAGSHTMAVV
jgi:hypothetical protein